MDASTAESDHMAPCNKTIQNVSVRIDPQPGCAALACTRHHTVRCQAALGDVFRLRASWHMLVNLCLYVTCNLYLYLLVLVVVAVLCL